MTRTGRPTPDTTAVPWLPVMPLWQVVLGSSLAGSVVGLVVRLIGRPAPWAVVAAVTWVSASVVAQPQVQRLLGGGRLDTRPALRMALATLLFGVLGTATGAGFLLPVFVVAAAMVHLQWSGPQAWRACAGALVLGTAAGQLVVVLGAVDCLVEPAASVALAVATTGVGLVVLTYACHVAAHREEHARALERAARLDPLTGVLSRAAFLAELERLVLRVRPGAGVGLLFCDLDGFKAVNDTYGHRAGDAVLARTARRLLAVVPVGALVGRVGGDEFLVAVTNVVDPVFLTGVAQAVGTAVARPVDLPDDPTGDRTDGASQGGSVHVGVTVGAAWTDDPDRSADDLVAAADAAMYAGKNAASR